MNRRLAPLMMILAAASLLLVSSLAARAYDYTYARVVRLSLAEGDVQVAQPRPPNDGQSGSGWEQAVVNLPIQQGYTLATGQGRAEVEFESGATARLAENSVLQFTELALSNGGRITRLTLTQGTATFYARLSRDDSFVVATPHLQVVIPENARFRVDVSDAGTQVSALKGEVAVDSRAGTNRLTKGNSLAYRTNDPDRVALERNYKTDDWDRWVADRDEVVHTASTAALQYVSSPYRYGLSDLYSYGNWYSVAGYGRCWRPYGVGSNWAPFWNGRWDFFPGLGWTWISYEPWGWLPYHYGRWVFSPTLGWLWAPGSFRHWQPALVTWVRIGNHTGWVPLHPNDRPGHTPTNLQQGVILTGAGGTRTTDRHERRLISREENLELLDGPPRGFAGAPRSAVDKTGGPPPVGPAGGNSDQRGIVFDPKERRFVNNPTGRGTKNGGDVGDAAMDTDRTSAPRGSSGTAQPKPSMQPPALRGPIGGPGGVPTGDGDAAPRKVFPPPPRMQPPPPPQPRVQPPPAPPNSERPAPRSESPRPAPAPRTEPAPRPSMPQPEPRSEHPRAPARPSRPDG